MVDEVLELDAVGQAERVRAGDVTPRELVDASIERIEKRNGPLNAVIHPLAEKARAAAADPALPDGPFRGVPFLVKDAVCHTAGDPYHMGMQVLVDADWHAADDTELARRFRRAGFVFVGKTNTPELAMSVTTEPRAYGATHNPWQPGRSTGGSSGGSAAAVAARFTAAAHANDMGGSIRVPAAHCGLVGLKPSRGRGTLAPHLGEYWGPLTHEHVVTRSLRDSAAILDAVCGPAPGDPYSAPPPARPYAEEIGCDPGALRVGLVEGVPGVELDRVCADAVRNTAHRLEARGHHVEPAALAGLDRPVVGPWFVAGAARELDRVGQWIGREIGENDVEPNTWLLAQMGRQLDAAQFAALADGAWSWVRALCTSWYDRFDVLLLPVTVSTPPRIGDLDPDVDLARLGPELARHTTFTMPFDLTGEPAVSLPVAESADGLPVATQLVAKAGREDVLFRVASQLDEDLRFGSRAPA